jgi:uncharacterized protein (TIGR03435 family)
MTTRLCGCLLAFGALSYAQPVQFEVASVKPAPAAAQPMAGCTGGPGTSSPARLTCKKVRLSWLVMMAYNLYGFQLKAPAWMDSALYEISASIPPDTDERQFQAMQQALLAERFGLRVHFEKKELTAYDLTVAKGGSKLTETREPMIEKPGLRWHGPLSGPSIRTMALATKKGESVADLADFLANQLGGPVRDATGLHGRYDYSMSFVMEPGGRAAKESSDPGSEPEPTLFDAVRQDLGLQLKAVKTQVDVLVVDKAEKIPTAD